jgi:hypothetical protein
MKFILTTLLLVFLFSCSKDEEYEKSKDVFSIRNIGLLATSEYTIGKVIELKDDNEWYKFGDRTILISCKAKVKAGINLQELQSDDIEVRNDEITVTLPYPTIISFDLDPNLIKTEMEDINGFRKSFTQEEKNEILALGEKSIKEKLKQTNILIHAKNNAEQFIINFYKELNFKKVHVKFKKPYESEFKAF